MADNLISYKCPPGLPFDRIVNHFLKNFNFTYLHKNHFLRTFDTRVLYYGKVLANTSVKEFIFKKDLDIGHFAFGVATVVKPQ
jgi:hypothetical protein